ncbi:MAG: radical SAM protein [Candidatus Omnitrophica bacterium]|nr:radical SAM protein [Candidatus Omnitrophota bacterium]
MAALRLHRWVPFSRANGPGYRAVIWVQGCTLGCPGCGNPATHPRKGGYLIEPRALVEKIASYSRQIEGVTISGGEPLQQKKPLLEFLGLLRTQTNLSVILFTGYSWAEVIKMREKRTLFSLIDVIIAGRYDQGQRLAKDLQGSANKTFHFLTRRYSQRDFQDILPAEILITSQGEIVFTGIDPLGLSDCSKAR